MLSFSKAPSRKDTGDLLRTGSGMGKKRVLRAIAIWESEEWQQTSPSELHVRIHYRGKGMVHVIKQKVDAR